MGDSTGGMLWIHLLQWIVSNNKPVPKAVVLHSPWPSLDFLDMNFEFSTDDSYLSSKLAFRLRQLVIGKDNDWFQLTDEERRKLNPKDNFRGFPPLYITAGTNELFINDIRTMTKNMKLAGVDVVLDEGEGLMHTYALFHLWSSKARCAQEKIRQWIQGQLSMNINSKSNIKMQSDFFC